MAKTRRVRHNRRYAGVKNYTLRAEKKAKKEAFKARKKADKEEEKRTDKMLSKEKFAYLNAARKSADRRIKLKKIRVKAQNVQWKLEEIESRSQKN